MTRPASFPDWALSDSTSGTSGQPNISQPPAAYQNYGYDFGEHPTRQYENWQGRTTGNWLHYHDDAIEPVKMTAQLDGTGMVTQLFNYDQDSIWGFQPMWYSSTAVMLGIGACAMLGGAAPAFAYRSSGALIKSINSYWSAGSGGGGRATIPLTSHTWYHVFIIMAADGTIDAGFDTHINCTNLLADSGYTYFRRVGSVLWNVSTLRKWSWQRAEYVMWDPPHAFTAPGGQAVITNGVGARMDCSTFSPTPLCCQTNVSVQVQTAGNSPWDISYWDGVRPTPTSWNPIVRGVDGSYGYSPVTTLTPDTTGGFMVMENTAADSTVVMIGHGYYDNRRLYS
jgi:hypothetical protein